MFLQKTTIDLTEYDEIYDALITLKVLKAIREYKLISPKNVKLNKIKHREEQMQGIMKALLFLMLKLSDNIVEDIHFDSRLIADLIYHNFMYKIVSEDKDKNVTFFYEYFINLIDKTIENSEKNYKKFKKLEVIKKYYLNKDSIEEKRLQINNDYVDVENFINKHSGLKNLKDVYQNLKEDIQYRYCVYKLKSIEKHKVTEIEDKNVCYTSSDEEEKETENKINSSNDNQALSATRRDFRSIRLRHKTNIVEEEELILNDDDQDNINNHNFIKALISDFLKYFSISNTNEISLNTLKHISVHIILANLYYEINKEGECLKHCTLGMEKIKLMQEKVSTLGNLTKFSFLSICVLFYEKMFYIFSKLSQRFDQKKTQFFIYLKMLDMGPIFDSRIRITVFQNIMDFMKKNELKKQRFSKVISGKNHKDEKEINCKIIRHKIRAMMNMTMKVPKFITYLIDVHCPILKERDFRYLFEKLDKIANNTTVNFALFNESLIFPPNNDQEQYSFLFNLDHKEYFNKVSTLDKAILASLEKFKYNEFPKNNNYLFVLTTIDSSFDFSIENISNLTLQIFKDKYSLILIIFWEDKIYESSDLKKKLHQLRKWIESNTNGILIVIKNYSVIKQLLTCVFPLKFKEFDPIVLKNMVTSIDLNLNLENILMRKTSKSQKKKGLISNESLTFQGRDEKVNQSNKVDDTVNEELIYFIN